MPVSLTLLPLYESNFYFNKFTFMVTRYDNSHESNKNSALNFLYYAVLIYVGFSMNLT
jgi:hypothetical protein